MSTRQQSAGTVDTEETPRAPDEHVVTSDLDFIQSGKSEDVKPKAAAVQRDGPNESDTATDDTQPAKPKRDRSAERRIARLAKKIAEAEAREAAKAARIAELEGELESVRKVTPKPKEPKFHDFDSPVEYAKAYAKWEADNEAPPPKSKPAAPRANQPKPPPEMLVDEGPSEQEVLDFRRRGKESLGDQFDQAMNTDGTPVNGVMASFITDSDYGPELYVYLAANQAKAKAIFDKGKAGEAELAKLESKAEAGTLISAKIESQNDDDDDDELEDDGATGHKRATKAPTPPSDTRPRGTTARRVDPENEDMESYAARRRKEEAQKRGVIL